MSLTELTLPPANVAALIERACRDGHPLQFLRELVQNALEAGATNIQVRPVEAFSRQEDGSTKQLALLSVQDNGPGMSGDDLRRFFMKLGESHNPNVGDPHANFGIGGKISTLPWNPAGVVLVSKTESDCSMVWLYFDKAAQRYGLRRWRSDEDDLIDVVYPYDATGADEDDKVRVNWTKLIPGNEKTGTAVVLLGDGTWSTAIPREFNETYYTTETIGVWCPPSGGGNMFPLRYTSQGRTSWRRRPVGSTRSVLDEAIESGVIEHEATSSIINWYIQDENWLESSSTKAKSNHNRLGRSRSFIAIKYNGELYHYRDDHGRWGIFDKATARRVNIIIESDQLIPDTSRSRLKPVNGADLPYSEWATHFAENMPKPLIELLEESVSASSSTIDSEIAGRLAHEFGHRFKRLGASIRRFYVGITERKEKVSRAPSQKKRSANSKDPGKKPTAADLPVGRWSRAGIDSPPAIVFPPNSVTPAGLVELNEENPIFCSLFEEWESKVDGLHKAAVVSIAKQAILEDYILRVAHAGNLPYQAGYSRDDVYQKLLCEEALLVIALGYISQHALIAPRIKAQLGIKVKL
jgi:hypothetical protein